MFCEGTSHINPKNLQKSKTNEEKSKQNRQKGLLRPFWFCFLNFSQKITKEAPTYLGLFYVFSGEPFRIDQKSKKQNRRLCEMGPWKILSHTLLYRVDVNKFNIEGPTELMSIPYFLLDHISIKHNYALKYSWIANRQFPQFNVRPSGKIPDLVIYFPSFMTFMKFLCKIWFFRFLVRRLIQLCKCYLTPANQG